MSDDYIRLIPADKNWQPAPEAAASAEAYVAGLFSGPGDVVWKVSSEFYDQVTLIDAGGLTTQITCPLCGGDVTEWGFGLLAEYRAGVNVERPQRAGARTNDVDACKARRKMAGTGKGLLIHCNRLQRLLFSSDQQ